MVYLLGAKFLFASENSITEYCYRCLLNYASLQALVNNIYSTYMTKQLCYRKL